ncbi:MAG: thiosulfate oxidation carrier protein SoxY [Paracoccus sp. (in: a-proteobacteria)]
MIDRRDMLAAGLTGAALAAMPLRLRAQAVAATAESADGIIAEFTGGAALTGAGLVLDLPETAENGNGVALRVDAPGATEILVLAPENPWPRVFRASFGPLSGAQSVATRIRLARSQEVIALARLADGRVARASAPVSVIIGGCGA